MTKMEELGAAAVTAERTLCCASSAKKDMALRLMAEALENGSEQWLTANAEDVRLAGEDGMSTAMLDRLRLTGERIHGIAEGIRKVISLPDPIGAVDGGMVRPNGLKIIKRRVPLGVIGIIYEARPNVTADAAALCLKSGNACILRGGKEAIRSNMAAVSLMRGALEAAGLDPNCICLVEDTSRESANELMHLDRYVDVLIPRGGRGLIRSVAKNATVPVIRTGEGVCHVYVDEGADLGMAANILENAKCSRPSVCNAAECVLVAEPVLKDFLAVAVPRLEKHHVELRCDEKALAALCGNGIPATEEDWDTEYDDYILAVKTVSGLDEAIRFINAHGTKHSETIVTESYSHAERFLDEVDAAAVYVNASTRFTDGGEFGLGAEIGISTQKLHARGPMGLEELTSIKYAVYGSGQVR